MGCLRLRSAADVSARATALLLFRQDFDRGLDGPSLPHSPSSPLISSPLPSSHASVALCARSVSAAPLGLGVANNAVPRYSAICSYAARWTFWCSVPHPTPGICISGSAPFTFERRPDRILPLATRLARWFHFKRAKS